MTVVNGTARQVMLGHALRSFLSYHSPRSLPHERNSSQCYAVHLQKAARISHHDPSNSPTGSGATKPSL